MRNGTHWIELSGRTCRSHWALGHMWSSPRPRPGVCSVFPTSLCFAFLATSQLDPRAEPQRTGDLLHWAVHAALCSGGPRSCGCLLQPLCGEYLAGHACVCVCMCVRAPLCVCIPPTHTCTFTATVVQGRNICSPHSEGCVHWSCMENKLHDMEYTWHPHCYPGRHIM